MTHSAENDVWHVGDRDAHRCATPPTALPGDEWTCPVCGVTYWADDEEAWGEGTFEWHALSAGEPDEHS